MTRISGRTETSYNRIVGIDGDEVSVLLYTFSYPDNPYHGAVGYRMTLIRPSEIQEYKGANICDVYRDLWQNAVCNGHEEGSLKDYANQVWAEQQEENALWPGDWDHSDVENFEDAIYDLYHRQMWNSDFKGFGKFMEWWADQLGVEVEELKDNYFQALGCGKEEEERWEELGVFRNTGGGRMFTPDPQTRDCLGS